MINNILKIISILFFYFFFFNAYSSEQFNFDVTEVEIIDNGNKFIGSKRGIVTSDNGIIIEADLFEYDKSLNILNASGDVKVNDTVNNYEIYTEQMIYDKKEEIIYTKNKSKGISLKDNTIITAKNFEYNKLLNIVYAEHQVVIIDKIKDYKIYSEFISYLRNEEKIYTKGKTSAEIHSKYNFKSKDVVFLRNTMELSSKKETTVTDNFNLYNLSKFKYLINQGELIGEKILISSNYTLPKNDKIYFSSGIINLKTQNFVAKDTKIKIHKNIFDNSDNDPRLKGVSSSKIGNTTIINKGVFTSCKENDTCPPWSIQAKEIKHDKDKKTLNYKNAFVKLYDIPILYFPKFFHPDPTVKRQSGLLKPAMNDSSVLGSSFTIPYYHVISNDSDFTFAPVLFDSNIKMIQNEYRKVGKDYEFTSNFGHTRDFYSYLLGKNKNISYLFSKFDADIDIENFNSSKISLKVEKVSNDTFLKLFDANLLNETTSLKPENSNSLSSELKFILDHNDFDLTTGFQSFENLQVANSDRYEYVLPYYIFNKTLFPNLKNGSISFKSDGSNNLTNTNQLKSQIINSLTYTSEKYFSSNGIKNNFNLLLKNLNSVGKNISKYKTSPQVELSTILELESSIPLIKKTDKYNSFLTPRLSFKVNPGDMKNYTTDKRTINADNIFSLERLGLTDTLEAGRSLTLGIDYRKEKLENMNKYFEVKLASVFRDKEENFIPSNTTLNKKTSNIFGTISNNFSENFKIDYNFAVDNNLNEIKYNDINTTLSVNNFVTSFLFIKEMDEMGRESSIENNTSLVLNDNNYFTFSTRRNRKINLTEFYDLVYEYKNDCLTAAIKYKKSYYEDRDLKPTEDLFISITLFPLTTFEQKVDNSLYRK